MDFLRFPLISMEINGFPWMSMLPQESLEAIAPNVKKIKRLWPPVWPVLARPRFPKFLWISQDVKEFLWISWDFHWFLRNSQDFDGFRRISVDFHGCPCYQKSLGGNCTKCLKNWTFLTPRLACFSKASISIISMDFPGCPEILIDLLWFRRNLKDFYRFLEVSTVFLEIMRISMDFAGFQWISMDVHVTRRVFGGNCTKYLKNGTFLTPRLPCFGKASISMF